MTAAAIYCRISQDRRDPEAGEMTMLGVQRQEDDCRALARREGLEVARVYVDNDVSATAGKVRPAYRQMLDDITAGRVGAIITWHPDRLYRRAVDLEELVKVCEGHKVLVKTVNAGEVDLASASGRLVAGLLATVARYEVEHKADRWRRSFTQRREAGQPFTGGPRLYGYDRQGVQVPDEAAHVALWLHLAFEGVPLPHIVEQAADDGVLTTRGNPWTATAMRRYLTNPRLAGWVTVKGQIVAESNWKPYLTEEQRMLLASHFGRAEASVRLPRTSWLRGLALCSVCSGPLATASRRGRRTYRCERAGCVEIAAEPLEDLLQTYVSERTRWPDGIPAQHLAAAAFVEAVVVSPALVPGRFSAGRVKISARRTS